MEAFATRDDLSTRWGGRTFTEAEIPMVDMRLMDATAYIMAFLNRNRIPVNPADDAQEQVLNAVCCDMARRSLSPMLDSGQGGGSNFTQVPLNGYMQTAGAFTEQFQFANPMGDLYLTDNEKRSLRSFGRERFRTIPVHLGGNCC